MKKKVFMYLLSAAVALGGLLHGGAVLAAEQAGKVPRVLEKSQSGNPMLGFDENGEILHSGDPSILVDGDTVYCYTGHDTSPGEYYHMPEWLCYSTKDMVNWKYEGVIMKNSDVSWRQDSVSAWASQVAKYNGKYYLYYCTEGNSSVGGGKCIGVAEADQPTGPFVDIGQPLVRNTDTTGSVHSWEDIDPTVWIETDEQGEEHRYLGWGNTRFFICELNPDMVSVKDLNGDNAIKMNDDIIVGRINGMDDHTFTEAPYYYRQQDDNGQYYGPYYMFFAVDWREQMAYATTDSLISNEWEFGGLLMEPSATANTNHMAVFDFKGKTYFVYHDGSLPHGSGFRRVACVEEFEVNADGTIDPIAMTAIGLTGTKTQIMDYSGEPLAHENFVNPLDDSFYPIIGKAVSCDGLADILDTEWEINYGKADKTNEQYVSIESNNKPGLYLAVDENDSAKVVLSQDAWGTAAEANRMTFISWEGLTGSGVAFESVSNPGCYLTSTNGVLSLQSNPVPQEATFFVDGDVQIKSFQALKTKRYYAAGDTLGTDDIKVNLYLDNGETEEVKTEGYTTNAAKIDMSKPGDKTLTVSYVKEGMTYSVNITITVVEPAYLGR